MSGTLLLTNNNTDIELDGDEKLSFSKFLDGKSEKTVNLEPILGIGGEGIVMAQKMNIEEKHYKNGWEDKIGWDVALKFVKFEKNDNEDFLGPENDDGSGIYGGINENEKWVGSQYFKRLNKLGDFRAATHYLGGYSRPYLAFGISEIFQNYYYVIG